MGSDAPAISEEQVVEATKLVATAMLPALPDVGRGTADHIIRELPEFGRRGATNLVLDACQANSSGLLDALMRGVPVDVMAPSSEVIDTVKGLVRGGISLDTVISGYQVGTAYWCQRWSESVQQHCTDLALALPVANRGTVFLLAWLQMATERLSGEYRDEAERLAREGSMARVAEVQRLFAKGDVDPVAASQRLGYNINGNHMAMVLRRRRGADVALEGTARTLAGTFTSGRPLVVLTDLDTAWCWAPATAPPKATPAVPNTLIAGMGRPGNGLEGFKRSHLEAEEAVRIATFTELPAGAVVDFNDIELISLCTGNPATTRSFLDTQLGRLASDAPHVRRLKETLLVFFDNNSNYRATAAALGLHHNTIRYRLNQAEQLLNHSTNDRRLELELALRLAAQLRDLPDATQPPGGRDRPRPRPGND